MFDVGRDLWKSSCPIPLLNQSHSVPFALLSHLHKKKNSFWCSDGTCCDVPTVSSVYCPLAGHNKKEFVSVLFTPSLQIFVRSFNEPSLFHAGEMLQSPRHFHGHLLDPLQNVHVLLVLGSMEQDTALWMWPHLCWVEEKDSSLNLLGTYILM